MRALFLVAVASITGCAPPEPAAAPPVDEPTPIAQPAPPEKARETVELAAAGVDRTIQVLTQHVNAREPKPLFELFSPQMKEAVNLEKTELIVNGLVNDNGKITSATRIPGVGNDEHGVFLVTFEKGEKLHIDLTISTEGTILGLRIAAPPAPDPAVAKTQLPLALPFRGQWLVFWGGDTLAVNQHVTHKSQRRAADLLQVGADKKTHTGDGKKNSDYLAYGEDVLAVADGKVETVIDGVPENEPGVLNPYFATGNTVILRHDDTTFSVYAHLQPGKLRVKKGQAVKRGAVLGLVGNSGNSSEPHLHFQVQDGARFEQSFGVEAVFQKVPVTRAGKTEESASYTFLKGDLIGK